MRQELEQHERSSRQTAEFRGPTRASSKLESMIASGTCRSRAKVASLTEQLAQETKRRKARSISGGDGERRSELEAQLGIAQELASVAEAIAGAASRHRELSRPACRNGSVNCRQRTRP